MSSFSCPIVTPAIQEIYEEIQRTYPEASNRYELTANKVTGWVDIYSRDKSIPVDRVTKKDTNAIVNHIEKCLNMDGKSFKSVPESITYKYQGKEQTYTILKEEGTSDYKIFNKDSKEVFHEDSKDRRKIFANLAVQQGRAVVVEHKNKKYVVNNRNQIISVQTGDEMKWGEENGDRKAILALSKAAFEAKQKAETTIANSNVIPNAEGNMSFSYGNSKRSNVKANTTFDAVLNGERTATTRYESDGHIEYWKKLKVGDIIKWKDGKGREVLVRVTKPLTKLNSNISAEEWSKKEGWSIDYFNSNVKPKLDQAWQLEYDLLLPTTNSKAALEGSETTSLPGPETKINIYAGTGENADLSNFAERPLNFGKITAYSLPEGSKVGAFTSKYPIYHIGERTYSTKQNPESGESFVFDGLSDLFSGRRFKTVEGAFQAAKLVFTHPKGNGAKGNKYWQPKEYTQRENSVDGVYYNTADVFVLTDEGEQLLKKFQEASGTQARSLGRQIEGLDRQEWDANSSKIMKAVIGRSFEANQQALQRLLATGNATLTHTQDKGKWGTEFPKLLMEVRTELVAKTTADNSGVVQEGVKDNNLVNSNNSSTFAPENSGDQIMPAIVTAAIETGNWSTEALKELDNLINDLEDGKVIYQRFPQEASRGLHQGGRANEAASLLLRGSKSSDRENTLSVGERYERDKIEQPIQEGIIESWAKAAGIWHDNLDAVDGKEQISEGGEAKVFYDDGDTHVTKILSTEYFITPQFALDRITLHNTLFPEAPLKIIGFGRSSDGDFKFLAEQPFIQGEHASKEEIQQFIERAGFTKSDKDKGNTYTTDDIYVSDLHDENVLKTKEGNLIVIDADIRWNTPELNRNGKHVIDNSLVLSSPSNAAQVNNEESATLAAKALTFGTTPTAEQQAAAQQRIAELNAPQPEKPKPERPKSVAYESALNVKDSRVAQFNRVFSPQQVKDRGAMISSMFSEIIEEHLFDLIDAQLDIIDSDTASEGEKNDAKQVLHRLKDPVNGRQYAAQEKGISVILDEIKQRLQWDLEEASDEMKPLWQNTLDYFPELFESQASLDIEEREGIRIIGLDIAEQTATDDENDAQDDGDDEVGHIASGSDGWSYQVRYTNPFDSLSRKVRSMLYEVERPESEKDDLGQTRYYPMGQIYASLLSYLAKNMNDSDAFMSVDKSYEGEDRWGNDITETSYPNGYPSFPVLEQMKTTYPWVQQIIDRLTDDYLNPEWNTNLRYPSTGGAMASQFYTNFRKAYIPYGKVQLGDGKFNITPLNYQMEDRAQYDKLEANYNNRMILSSHSIYNSDGKVNKDNAEWLKKKISEVIFDLDHNDFVNFPELMEYHSQHPEEETLTSDDIEAYNKFIADVRNVLQSFGIDAAQDGVVAYLTMDDGKVVKSMLSDLSYAADRVTKVADDKIDSFNYIIDLRNPYNESVWKHFFDGRGLITDASYMQSFYDSASKKTKYSYSADNYLMKTFRGAAMGTLEQRRAFIDAHFGKYEWFRNQNTGEWRNKWLEYWYNHEGDEKEIPYRNVDNVTEYGEDGAKIRQYSKWEPDDIWQVQNRSYNPESEARTAFYLAPIFSDSPMSMTVKGPKMSMEELLYGYNDDSGHHSGALVSLVNQELYRIGYVQERAEAIERGEVTAIANFDDIKKDKGYSGARFCFIPELNNYVFEATDDYPSQSFLERMVSLKKDKATRAAIEESEIQALQDIIGRKMSEYQAENIKEYQEKSLKPEQYYNMVYANAAIIQMTTVDLAFYKDDTDFQKRFKEVYAGGIQLNTNSKYGKKTENIIILSDDIITSPSYDKIAAIIDGSSTLSQKDKDDIKASFQDINVADAQAIRSMHSFRSVLDMMGNWTDEMEQALQHFKEGTWDRADFDIIYQTIKPFVYSVIERNDGKGENILVPQQNKNSEICALMMYDLITNGLNDSPVYKALSRFMEDTVDGDGNQLIDMIQYESAGKVGNQGVVNISYNPDKVVDLINGDFYDTKEGNSVAAIIDNDKYEFTTYWDGNNYLDNSLENADRNYQEIKQKADYYLEKGEMSQDDYNKVMQYLRPTEDEIVSMLEQAALVTNSDGTKGINPEIVHTIPFDNYYQQQPTPEHHIDAEATFGSQARNIIVADLPEDFELSVPVKGGNHTFKGRDAIIDFYYELLNENLIEDFFGKGGNSKGLKGIFESKEALRDAVTDIVRGNPKYGRDFADALQLDDNGNFVLNPNSPTIFNLMQEIVTSFFKNRITKQTINGAALIQAAGIGLDKDLHMVFDKNGKLLGAECLMPLTSKQFFEPLLETQVIDGKEVKVLNPEKLKKAGLDKAIGYRIPTENKSSMMPLIIKDFTPLQNGSAIVLPAEITDIAGSDFDVDKMFVMLLSFYVQNYDMKKAREDYAREDAVYKELLLRFTNSQLADELLDIEPQSFKEWFADNQDRYKLEEPVIRKIQYDFSKTPKENGRKARNNMLIQMMFGILTSKEGSESLFNPQGFKDVKRAAKITRILTDNNLNEQLIRNTSEVGPGVLPSADTIIAEFMTVIQDRYPEKYDEYKAAVLNMTTEQVQQAYIQAVSAGNKGDAIRLLLDSSTKDLEKFIREYSAPESPIYPQTFAHSHARNMAGMNQIGIYAIQGSMAAKYQRASVRLREEHQFTINGRTISNVDVSDDGRRLKNVGQMIGASADNGKDPNLSDMGSTSKTAPMIGYMLRTGLSHLEAALIINQKFMSDSYYTSKNWKYWNDILGKNPLATPAENVTTDMLIKGLISPFELTVQEEKAIAGVCYRILKQHEAQEYMTQISRADSPNGAIQNSYAKARLQRYKVDLFQAKMGQRDFPFIRINEALSNNAIDITASEEVVREQLKGQRMAFLHGMYALGINSFNSLVGPYFFEAQQWFDDDIVKPILYNMNEKLSDDEKTEIVNAIYTSYITFMLSGSSLFGSEENATMKSKRDYYLDTFPSDYQKIIQENEDIRDLFGTVLQVQQFGSRKRVILQDVGSLSKGQKQDVQRRFDALIYSDNPVARNLAKDLFVYSYFDNGLQFTHDSFSHLFTTEFVTSFPAYTDTLNSLDERISPEEETNFIHQFLLTYNNAAYNVNYILRGDKGYTVTDSRITIDLNDKKMRKMMINEVMSPNPQSEGINVYPYIQYQGEIYVLNKDLFNQWPGTPVYEKLSKYSTFPRLPLFNKEMSVAEMAKEFPVTGNNRQDEEIPSIGTVDAPVAHNEGSGDPNVGPDSMYDEFASMDDFMPEVDWSDVPTGEQESKTDSYQSEGEGELKDPFC